MTPTDKEQREFISHLERQHPSSYTRGTWYPAVTMFGKPCEIRKTSNHHGNFLHVRMPTKINVVTPDNEIIDTMQGHNYFRVRLRDNRIEDLGYW